MIEHECELVTVEVARNQGMGLLRITVDNSNGDGRVAIERCVGISREVETLLDASDQMPGAYKLEVSSPGLDRVLGREKDFVAAIGLEIKLRTRRPIEGRKRFRGRLLSVEENVLKMQVEGIGRTKSESTNEGTKKSKLESSNLDSSQKSASQNGDDLVLISIVDVEKAKSIYEFTSADFAKKSTQSGSSQSDGK